MPLPAFLPYCFIATYRDGQTQVIRWADEVVGEIGKLGEHRYLQLSVQQPDAYGVTRNATIELNSDGSNEVRVQGVQEAWVLGKAEALCAALRRHEKRFSTTFSRYGVGFYQILFFGSFVVMPELPLMQRVIFFAVMLVVLLTALNLHRRFVPLALIHLSERKPTAWERAGPSILSWVIAATSGLAATAAFNFLQRSGSLLQRLGL